MRSKSARERAHELMAQIQIDGDGPTRADQLVELSEVLVELIRDTNDRETLDSWSDVMGFLLAAVRADVERIGGAA